MQRDRQTRAQFWITCVLVAAGLGAVCPSRAAAQAVPPDTGGRPIVFFQANGEAVSNVPPIFTAQLTSPPFRSGQPLQLQAFAIDSDGLGFPVFAFAGITTPISFLWNFGGGQANGLAVFAERPVVTFTLPPGPESATFTVTLTAFDRTGLSTTATGTILVTRTGPPVVNLLVDGLTLPSLPDVEGVGVNVVDSDGVVQLGSLAFDESGLGFPIFADLGNPAPVSYFWSFGGGQPANALDVFSPSPRVTFPIGPGPEPTPFRVSLTVFDATGQSTTRATTLFIASEFGPFLQGSPR